VADLGEGPGWPRAPSFWVKRKKITEGRKAGRASKTKLGPPLAQGLDLPPTPIYIKQYGYVPLRRVWFSGSLVWNRV